MFATWKNHEGQSVDGIALLRLLGSGESSAVFQAQLAGQPCAIKLIPTEDVVAQLPLSRWEAASKLSHPHLSRILQSGRGSLDRLSLVYVAMEYAEEELSSVDRPLTPREAREMLYPTAKVLAYLHGKGLAHGRIKPPNILSVQDELKISGDAPLHKGDRHASSPAPQPYDPPELAETGVTPAGDVWSLGVSLVWAMTKELPAWEGDSLRLPASLRPDIFREVATGCLVRDPARRWTVADMTQWLERDALPSAKRGRMRYFVPLAAATGVVALGAAGWTYLWPHVTASQPAQQPEAKVATSVTPQSAPPPAPLPALPEAAPKALSEIPPLPKSAGSNKPEGNKHEAKQEAASKATAASNKPAPAPEPEPKPKPEPAAGAVAVAADVTAPDVVNPVVPVLTAKARGTIHGKVPIVVRVQADATGAVSTASVESGASSKYFANLALAAARQWKFAPGADARQWLLRFEFTHDADRPVNAKVILRP